MGKKENSLFVIFELQFFLNRTQPQWTEHLYVRLASQNATYKT